MKKEKPSQYVRLPLPVLEFLLGKGQLEGVWFGELHPTKPGRYWWRSSYFGKNSSRTAPAARAGKKAKP